MAMSITFPVQQVLDLFSENKTKEMWIDYDREADVLYVNLQRPVDADHSEMDDDTIIRYQGDQIVGFTILNASKKRAK